MASLEKAPAANIALVADASPERNDELRQFLTLRGWEVYSVYDGRTALSTLSSRRVTLAVVWVELPKMDGVEMVGAARAAGWREQVIFIDTTERPELRRQCAKLGALAYLAEPLALRALARLLQRAGQPPTALFSAAAEVERALRGLTPGLQVQLCILSGSTAGSYTAAMVEAGPASLTVSVAALHGPGRYVSLGTGVRLGFATGEAWGEFESQVAGSCVRNSMTEITLSRPSHVAYYQRRRSPRMRMTLPLYAWPTTHPDRAGVMLAGQTEDLGERGLRASFHGLLPEADLITLAIDPGPGQEEVRLNSRLVWHQPLGGGQGQQAAMHRYGFQFVHPSPRVRQRVKELRGKLSPSLPDAEAQADAGSSGAGPETSTEVIAGAST